MRTPQSGFTRLLNPSRPEGRRATGPCSSSIRSSRAVLVALRRGATRGMGKQADSTGQRAGNDRLALVNRSAQARSWGRQRLPLRSSRQPRASRTVCRGTVLAKGHLCPYGTALELQSETVATSDGRRVATSSAQRSASADCSSRAAGRRPPVLPQSQQAALQHTVQRA
jgi:hypothetical protein